MWMTLLMSLLVLVKVVVIAAGLVIGAILVLSLWALQTGIKSRVNLITKNTATAFVLVLKKITNIIHSSFINGEEKMFSCPYPNRT